jgi:hypothetical protein
LKAKVLTGLLFILFFNNSLFSQWNTSDIIISEVMFYAPSGNNEFIEIYNKSETEYKNLYGFKLKYYTSNSDSIIDAGYGIVLPPKSYAVIFEGDYSFSSGIYNSIIPPGALKLKIDDNSFGTNGMANTTSRSLRLINTYNDTVDYYSYSANNSSGYSDEKELLNNDTSAANWGNALRYLGSPGYKNSVSPSLLDISVHKIKLVPAAPFEFSSAEMSVTVKNRGINAAGSFSLFIYNDKNLDSIPSPDELLQTFNYNSLSHNDSVTAVYSFITDTAGLYNFIARAELAGDEDTLNNILMHNFYVLHGSGNVNKIVVNEIMYAPESGHPEWVELYNRSNEIINLKKWRISDNSTSAVITNNNKLLAPGSFVVLSRDSSVGYFNRDIDLIVMSLPQLNNSGDRVVVKDSLANIIDSLDYLPLWGGTNGNSLERIDTETGSLNESNWNSSKSRFKGTPGKLNSVTPKNYDLALEKFTAPKYIIKGSSINLKLQVKNEGLQSSSPYTVKFYYDENADSAAQESELFYTASGSVLLSGDSTSLTASFLINNTGINYFIAEVHADTDYDSDNNITYTKCIGVEVNEIRNDIVINEIMYAPETNHPEYFELYNKSSKTINLKNYSAADAVDTIKIINSDLILQPSDYLVIAADSSFYSYYSERSKVIIKNIPSLNNTGDAVMIIDSLSRVIDSLIFTPYWGGSKGNSLERISSLGLSVDSVNWRSSISRYKGTPGYINSVSLKQKDVEASRFIFTPVFPVKGDTVSISVMLNNNGTSPLFMNVTLFEDTDLDSLADFELQSINNVFISDRDSLKLNFTYKAADIISPKGFYCIAETDGDQDTSNNYIYSIVEPGAVPSSIVINEIMYSPLGGEPEWIELFNRSNDRILIKDWSISDVITTPQSDKIKDSVFVEPKNYLVLSSDSSIYNYHLSIPSQFIKMPLPSFNNTGDGVVLKDSRKLIIDSVLFAADWGGQNGVSLERISHSTLSNLKTNWGSSADIEGSSPGRINSITQKEFDPAVARISFTPAYPLPGDNITVSAVIKNHGTKNSENVSASFLFKTGSTDSLLGMRSGLFILSKDSITVTAPSQIITLNDSAVVTVKIYSETDEDTSNNYLQKKLHTGVKQKSLVINEIMFDPKVNEPEWIEIYNPGTETVNLKNWIIADIITPSEGILSVDNKLIPPGEFVVVAKDSTFRNFYPDDDIDVIYAGLGILGNTGDGVILKDFRGAVIDSVFYTSGWDSRKGYSIERMGANVSSCDSTNWFVSLSSSGATPGKANSVLNILPSEKNSAVINEIMFDPGEGNCEFIELFNNSDKDINISGWNILDKYSNKKRIAGEGTVIYKNSYFIAAADSCFLVKYGLSGNIISVINTPDLGLTTEGTVYINDLFGNMIDSVCYSDKWHNKLQGITKDKSLERINPSALSNDKLNWNTSVSISGATPNQQNSIFLDNKNSTADISVSPNPFSPDNDGFEDVTFINYRFGFPLSSLVFKIFDSKGRLVKTIQSEPNTSGEGNIVYDGNGDDNIPLRMGIYILLAEGRSYISGEIKTLKCVFVVARRLN